MRTLRFVKVAFTLGLLLLAAAANASVDLWPSNLALSPTSAGPGGTVTLTWTFNNSGTESVSNAVWWVVYSHDSIIDTSDTVLRTGSKGLVANEHAAMTTSSLVIPASAVAGTRYIGVILDPTNAIVETSETNNKASKSFTVSCSVAPGTFSLTSPSNGASYPGGTTSVTLSWGSASGATSYHVFFSEGSNALYYTETTGRSYPVPVSDGKAYSWDIRAANTCGTTWSSSGERTFSIGSCSAPGAFSNIAPSNGYIIDPPAESYTIVFGKSNGATSYKFYFGTSSSPPLYSTMQAAECAASECKVTVPLAFNTKYYWRAEAINTCATTQSTSGTWNFTNPPKPTRDLYASVSSVSPATLKAGAQITPSFQTTNSGNSSVGASVTKVWLSANTSKDAGDTYICEQPIPSLGAGATTPGSCTWAVPSSTPPGAWYVIAEADAGMAIAEDREDNNTGFHPITVEPTGATDLEATSITISPTGTIDENTLVTVSGRITNVGGTAAGAFSWALKLDGQVVKTGNVAGLAPAGYVSESIINWSSPLTRGTHRTELVADTGGSVSEQSETNNVADRSVAVGQQKYGTTVITHGLSKFHECAPAWTYDLAIAIQHRIGKGQILRYNKRTGQLTEEIQITPGEFRGCQSPQAYRPPLPNDLSGERIIIFDWAEESDRAIHGYSEAAAEALLASLYAAEQATEVTANAGAGLRIDDIHLIGHSRGTVVNSEIAERLISLGRTVGQITTLDPHDFGGDFGIPGDDVEPWNDFDVNARHNEYPRVPEIGEARGVVCWTGVSYCDNYYQMLPAFRLEDPLYLNLWGIWLPGTANLFFSNKSDLDHSAVPTWYQLTSDTSEEHLPPDPDPIPENWFDGHSIESDVPCVDVRDLTGNRDTDGFGFSIRVKDRRGRCNPDLEEQTASRFDWTLEGLTNGNIQQYRNITERLLPGWQEHVLDSEIQSASVVSEGLMGNLAISLTANTGITHNRFLAPPNATGIAFRYAVVLADTQNTLQVRVGGNYEPVPLNLNSCMVDPLICNWREGYASIPNSQRGSMIGDLRFALPFNSTAQVLIDNVRIVLGGLSAPNGVAATRTSATSSLLSWIDTTTSEAGFILERRPFSGPWLTVTNLSANTQQFTDSGLDACTSYDYRLYATDLASRSAYSAIASVGTMGCPTKPDAPSTVSVTTLSASSLRIQWSDVSSETGYGVQYRTESQTGWHDAGQVAANVTILDVPSLLACTTYVFRVYAFNAAATSFSPEAIGTTAGCVTAPTAPAVLTARSSGSTSISLSWTDASSNELGFLVEHHPDGASIWSEVGRTGPGAGSSQVGSLSPCTTHHFRVRAYNSAGSSSPSNEAYSTTLGCVSTPNAPTQLSAVTLDTGGAELRWMDNASNETGFTVERRVDTSGTWTAVGSPAANAVTYNDSAPPTCSTLYYRVKAVNGAGSSGWSNEASVRTRGCVCTSYSISPNAASPIASAGFQMISISGMPAGCDTGDWTAFGNSAWLSVSPGGGSGPGIVTVNWTDNSSGAPRSSTATIAGNTFSVTQAGGGDLPLEVLLDEPFTSNTLPSGFTVTAGTATVQNGVLNLADGCTQLPNSYSRAKGLAIDVDVAIDWGGAGDFNVWALYDQVPSCHGGPKNGYYHAFYPVGSDNPTDSIHAMHEGVPANIGTAATVMSAATWAHVRIEYFADGRVNQYVNGQLRITGSNSDFASGLISLRSWGNVRIDNLRITTIVGGGRFRLDENTGLLAQDSSGAGNHGRLVGSATWTTGHDGAGILFPDTSAAIQLPRTIWHGFTNTIYTEAWINPTAHGSCSGAGTIIRKRAPWNDFYMSFSEGDQLDCVLGVNQTSGVGIRAGSIPLNQWTKVACHYTGTSMKAYVNDVLVGEQAATLTPDWFRDYVVTEIGNNTTDNNCAYNFPGYIDEVVIAQAPGSSQPPAPASVIATAATATSVSVSWSPATGAATYDIYRRGSGGSYVKIGSSGTTTYPDNTAAANTAYLYAVKSVSASFNESPLSNPDLATTVIFTDPTLTPGTTPVKAVHIAQLRTAVNAVRALAGLLAATWTDSTITPGVTTKAAHVTELRTALTAARSALGFSAPIFIDPTITPGGHAIKATHLAELRNGVK